MSVCVQGPERDRYRGVTPEHQQASAATEQQTASMEEMAASAQQLARTADTLKDLVSLFKVDS